MPRRTTSKRPAAAIESALRAVAKALAGFPQPGMIIGGIAVIARGVARLTKDIDATIPGANADLNEVVSTLTRRKILPRIANAVSFAQGSNVLLLRHEPSGVDVDLSLAWLPFELDAIRAAEEASIHGMRIRVPTVEDLVVYKIVAWRPQDQQDVERLVALHGTSMNLDRVRHLAAQVAAALDDPDRVDELERVLVQATKEGSSHLARLHGTQDPKSEDPGRRNVKGSKDAGRKRPKRGPRPRD